MTALALVLEWVVLGLHVLVPWRLARQTAETPPAATSDPRRLWAMVATPLWMAAALAGLFGLGEQPDAALAWGFAWPNPSIPALALAVFGLAVGLADLLLFFGYRELEPAGWRIAAGLGGATLLAASLAGELLRLGRGPAPGLAGIAIAACCRAALALAAGEASAGRVRYLPMLAGAALSLSLPTMPAVLRAALGTDLLTLGAAASLLLAARFLPPTLQRPAALAGVLLAALFLDRTSALQAALEPSSIIPEQFLPEP